MLSIPELGRTQIDITITIHAIELKQSSYQLMNISNLTYSQYVFIRIAERWLHIKTPPIRRVANHEDNLAFSKQIPILLFHRGVSESMLELTNLSKRQLANYENKQSLIPKLPQDIPIHV